MISEIANKIGLFFRKTAENIGLGKIQKMLENRMSDILDLVLSDRKNDSENKKFTKADTEKILQEYMIKNVTIATATSFVPGPAGMLASVPGMLNSLSNQMKSTYDIACAYGKENLVVKDLLIDIPLQAMGIPAGLADRQQLTEMMEADQNIIAEKIKGLGKVIATKKLKGAVTSMIPGMSTVFAITQAKMETAKVIATATTFFDPDEVMADPEIDLSISEAQKQEERIKTLINLLTLDDKASPEEIKFISPIIKKSALSKAKKSEYQAALGDSSTDYVVDYELLRKSGDAEEVVMDMAVLTKRDGKIGPRELEYVKFAAEKLKIHPIVYKSILD